jgi:hypothetical protein
MLRGIMNMKFVTDRYQGLAGKVSFVKTSATKGCLARANKLRKYRPWLCVLRPFEASSSEGGFANHINTPQLKLVI